MSEYPCWKCGTCFELLSTEKVGFKALCDSCGSYLHVCKACQYYRPGKPNDCLVPGTDRVVDREYYNYCDEFKPGGQGADESRISLDDARRLLFGDDE